MECRPNEDPGKNWFRSNRLFTINSQWYFATREGHDVGPFSSVSEAKRGVQRYLQSMESEQSSVELAEFVAKNGEWAITYYQ